MTERARAAGAALDWLSVQDAPESAIALHEAGMADSDEEARRWVRRILDRERDGAWDGDLLATVEALMTLRELRDAASLQELDPAIGRGLDWIEDRRGRPGTWTEGCTPERHRRGLCHHFAAGFYSPGPGVLSAVELHAGAPAAGDAEARLAISAAALRCTLLWRGLGTDARLHLEALGRIIDQWERSYGLTTTALLAAARALAASPRATDREMATRALGIAAGRQRADGSWPDADPFYAMAVLSDAVAAGIRDGRVGSMLDYGTRLLIAAQHGDGSWGPVHGPRRALIGWRTLRQEPWRD